MIAEIIDQLLVGPQTLMSNMLVAAVIGYAFIVNAPTLKRWLSKSRTKTE